MKELSEKELKEVEGGFCFFRWEGWLDGVRGNTNIILFGFDIV